MLRGDKSAKRKERQRQENLAKPPHKRTRGHAIQPTRIENPNRGKGKKYNRHEWQKEAIKYKNLDFDQHSKSRFIFLIVSYGLFKKIQKRVTAISISREPLSTNLPKPSLPKSFFYALQMRNAPNSQDIALT